MKVTQGISAEPNWNLTKRIAFRFFFVFFIFNIVQKLGYYIPAVLGAEDIAVYINSFNQVWAWIGQNVLNINRELHVNFNGSGDTTVNYIFQVIAITTAILVTALWSLLDVKRKEYNQLFLYLRILIRYYLALTMFLYGFSKVFCVQFSEVSNFDLIKTFGDQSPMGLLWNFMEYSNTYTRFSGIVEVLVGVLLLYRRTVVFGSLILIGIMLNVFMMNMSYDIPVKSYSIVLIVMGIFILAPDIKRILEFFVLNKVVQPKIIAPYFSKQKHITTGYIVKGLCICFLILSSINFFMKIKQERSEKSVLYGIYEVEEFIKNNDTLAPLTTDSFRWKRLIIDKRNSGVQTMDERIVHFKEKTDTVSKTLTLTSYKDSTDIQSFSYIIKDSLYIFESIYKSDTLKIKAKKKERDEFLLINRGFHWINEYPFNR
ncbi:hypothetical protein [Aquimarina mytili]|uniref:DoxX family protein n=1 Tax=Aquimarina mytili TaxID=874423 RepID=A0A937D4J3_9FLAO|nr:hypothetical protein [Aquimarina mytili]MBL0682254.1 hypothetical protein [Aquimarina mytili]